MLPLLLNRRDDGDRRGDLLGVFLTLAGLCELLLLLVRPKLNILPNDEATLSPPPPECRGERRGEWRGEGDGLLTPAGSELLLLFVLIETLLDCAESLRAPLPLRHLCLLRQEAPL